MSENEEALDVQPADGLTFNGPYTEAATKRLKLSNPTDKRIAFKVKTNAVRRYFANPSYGIVEPHSEVMVNVIRRPFDLELHRNSGHKFKIEMMIDPADDVDLVALWKDISPSRLISRTIPCYLSSFSEEAFPVHPEQAEQETKPDVGREEHIEGKPSVTGKQEPMATGEIFVTAKEEANACTNELEEIGQRVNQLLEDYTKLTRDFSLIRYRMLIDAEDEVVGSEEWAGWNEFLMPICWFALGLVVPKLFSMVL